MSRDLKTIPLTLPAAPRTRLLRLLQPRSIALVGGSACAEIVRQCRKLGYAGRLWPVHPSLDEIEGLKVYRSVAQLPQGPDAAFIAVNRQATLEAIRALAIRDSGGAVCYASGFSESGPQGRGLQNDLAAAALDMPYFGPNCHGFINYLDGVALWPEQQGARRESRGVALVTQSGNIALNLTMQARGLPLSYVVTLGNQANLTLADAIEALIEDERVTAIGLHIEGVADPARFLRASARARARGIAIVALKCGSSPLGARLGLSHTASLAGADEVAGAFLKRAGVPRVRSLPVLLETLKVLHVCGPLRGADIASMSCSGGEAGLVADAGLAHGLNLRPFSAAQERRIRATLPALAQVSNPLDYHNFTWNDPKALEATYAAVLSAGFDLSLLVMDFPRTDRCSAQGFEAPLGAFIHAAQETPARAAVIATLPESLPEARARELIGAGVVPLLGLEEGLAAIGAAAACGNAPLNLAPLLDGVEAPEPDNVRTWSEWAAKQALHARGLAVPRARRVGSPAAAAAAADELGYPVVLKAVGSSITHKTELGAVRLNLRSPLEVEAAAHEILVALGTELLVEEMIEGGVAELIVGISRDPVFGLYLVIGSGGVLVELVADRCTLLLPASDAEIRAAITSLRAARLIWGYRRRPSGDLDAAVAAVRAIQDFALTHPGRLVELDVNPLIVREHDAIAVDALLRMSAS
ncbi:MAG: acetate--CoA ligase family protein [Proteobacteria bacterium]|nr:acetate--CoA ligase family protein [Pseudomonadota bacterium]